MLPDIVRTLVPGVHESEDIATEPVPYPHQVGGHGLLTRAREEGRVLKPFTNKERAFYMEINSEAFPQSLAWLREYTAKYFGQVSVMTEEDEADGLKRKSTSGGVDEEGFRKVGGAVVSSRVSGSFDFAGKGHCRQGRTQCAGDEVPTASPIKWKSDSDIVTEGKVSLGLSPWARTMNNVQSNESSERLPRLYVSLEDLAWGYRRPSVMDCKMGTRHYDDDATPEKRRRHIWKSQNTTSWTKGLRITGMQVFRGNDEFLFRDKYHGRRLKGEDLVREFRTFFDNGKSIRVDCLKIILDKLRRLAKHMECQRRFRFYSSSLLLVYEGDTSESQDVRADVKMIDFAHTQSSYGELDEGYIFGLQNLMQILEEGMSEELSASTS